MSSNNLKVSICIPAYKHVEYLEKLLDSILIQSFKEFEVVITDDSNDSSVKDLIEKYQQKFVITYQKNPAPLGTPENWNEAMRKAKGDWIKLMHDDDWFADENSLRFFYEATLQNPECSFFFSAYRNVSKDSEKNIFLNSSDLLLLKLSPLNLFKKQYIGNPSCILVKRDLDMWYDKDFKWVVDFEYYIRCLRKKKNFFYINKPLINVGLNDEQVTNYTFRKPEVEIPENHLLIEKMGVSILRNIFVYDYYWRLYRNLEVKNIWDVKKYYTAPLHPLLKQMIGFQNKIPTSVLKNGAISKILMSANYLMSLFRKI
jgi:glycosyltransferase involved in cell wall biosynthesis